MSTSPMRDETTTPAADSPKPGAEPLDRAAVEEKVVAKLKTVFDPEIPVNIHELGLIYGVEVTADAEVFVKMTLTAPGCPVAGSLPGEVEAKIRGIPEVRDAHVELVWDPAWNPTMMSEAAKLQLGFNF